MLVSRKYLYGVVSLVLAAAACGGPKSTAPESPWTQTPPAPLPLASLSGAKVLLLTVGGVVAGDSAHPLPGLEARRSALLTAAYAALDTALRRDAREVEWMGLEEQERAARRNPTLNIQPARFNTSALFPVQAERVPDPLWGQIRTISAVTGARYLVAPAGVRFMGTEQALTATYVLVMADARTGAVVWRGRLDGGPQATPEAALASAAATAVVNTLR
jgi:hypothetical protein